MTGSGPSAGYLPHDLERLVAEAPKNPDRGEFARDRARVVHSAAFRRLADKTQVLGADQDDFSRNRLTHSLEVAQIGRELAGFLGADPDLVDTACLAHDLGHPPFGHNGERALAELSGSFGGFEGNAQTLRILTRLEPKVITEAGLHAGLNLTLASLDAATKYPWVGGADRADAGARVGKAGKFGAYAEDSAVFTWFRPVEPDLSGRRCLEAQIMDLADDIAYGVHDIEDALVAGYLQLADLERPARLAEIAARCRDWYTPQITDAEVAEAVARLAALPAWIRAFDGSHRALAALKNLTSQLIGRFSAAAAQATREAYGTGPLTRYRAELVVPAATRVEIDLLKAVVSVAVLTKVDRLPMYLRQRQLLADLVGELTELAPAGFDHSHRHWWDLAESDAARRRVVVDQVAALTDRSAWLMPARLRDIRRRGAAGGNAPPPGDHGGQ